MAATLTTSTWNIAYDYSDYYERIATALENLAANSTATITTLTNISVSLDLLANNSTSTLADLSTIAVSLDTIAASSTATLSVISDIANTSTLINSSLATMSMASILSAISNTPSGVVDIDADSIISRGDASFASQVFGKLPTYNYVSTATTSTSAEFETTVGGNTGTWMFVSSVITGTILTNMEVGILVPNTTSTQLNLIVRQLAGTVGSTGTYELKNDTGYYTTLNKGNSPSFTATAVLHTGTEVIVSVQPFGDATTGLFNTLLTTLPKSI